MQFERYALDEITQIIGTPDGVRVWAGGWATYGDRPFMGVTRGSRLVLVEQTCGVPEDDWTVYAQTLFENTYEI